MGVLNILNADRLPELALWIQMWSFQPAQEIFAHPKFVKLFCRPADTALCAYMELSGGVLMFPFILRPLPVEKWAGEHCQSQDIISPYGYGGLVYSGSNAANCLSENNVRTFWREFDAWSRNNKIVSCFIRFSPYSCYIQAFSGRVEPLGEHVIRLLSPGLPEIWNDFDHKVRTNIRRALRTGLEVEIDTGSNRLEEFKKIYYATMDRHHAQPQYYFPEEFFSAIRQDLPGKHIYFHTLQENKVISTELVLISQDYLYSFLGGTDKNALKLYPNEILKEAVIRWGIEHGKKAYALGGGYKGQDSLFHYKKSLAPRGIVSAMVGKKIYDETAYQTLCEMRLKYEIALGNTIDFTDEFFPAYRNCATAQRQ